MAKNKRTRNTYFERIKQFLSVLLIVAFLIVFVVNNGNILTEVADIEKDQEFK